MLETVTTSLYWAAALVVLIEAFNKLERCDPLEPGLDRRARLVVVLKAVAWTLLALAAAGIVIRPALVASMQPDPRIGSMLLLDPPSVTDLLFALGFTVLIVRSRVKEHVPASSP